MIIKVPFRFFSFIGMAVWPFIFINEKYINDERLIRHEKIHLQQWVECLVVPFPFIYGWFFFWQFISTFSFDKAYRGIPFEREAYTYDIRKGYLKERKAYAWVQWC